MGHRYDESRNPSSPPLETVPVARHEQSVHEIPLLVSGARRLNNEKDDPVPESIQ